MDWPVRVVEIGNKDEAYNEMVSVGVDLAGIRSMADKAVFRVVRITGALPKQANIIKQEMLAKGGEAAVCRGVVDNSVEKSDVLLLGTMRQYKYLVSKLKRQPFRLKGIAGEIEKALANYDRDRYRILTCRDKELVLGERTLVMGILNVTPDSFSDGGEFYDSGLAVERARQMVEDGADIVDIGGESTRPGYRAIPPEEELGRLLPVLNRLVNELPVPISIDTYKADVAREALELGVQIVNDQWSFRADPKMAKTVAEYDVPVIFMHNQKGTEYKNLMGDMTEFFRGSIQLAEDAGVNTDGIILDPGFGFGKTPEQNLIATKRMTELRTLGKSILLGPSRKSTIGKVLGLPVDDRIEGTAALVALGIAYGADIVRVHDVKEMVRVVRMSDALVRGIDTVKVE